MSKCQRAAYRYIAARVALIKLCPKGGTWSSSLHPLNIKTDLRNTAGVDPEDDLTDQRPAARWEQALGEGHKDIPWIWRALAPSQKEQVNDDEATAEEVIEGLSGPFACSNFVLMQMYGRDALSVLQGPGTTSSMEGRDRAST